MRDPKRIDEVLGLIKDIWATNPDWRFNQLIINCGLTTAKSDVDGLACFFLDPNVEDDEILNKLYTARAKYCSARD